MTLGEKLQALRIEAGLSQEELAERLGVSRQAVSKWELDKTVPEVRYIVALSSLFGVTTDALLKEDAAPPPPSQAAPQTPVYDAASLAPGLSHRSTLLLSICAGLSTGLLSMYISVHCFPFFRRPQSVLWAPWTVLIAAPAVMLLACGLLTSTAPAAAFRRAMSLCTMLWGLAAAVLLGFAEVIQDLVADQVMGPVGLLYFGFFLLALLVPLWLLGWLLAHLALKKRR